MYFKYFIRAFYRFVISLIPYNNLGDKIFSLIHFIKSQHRLPSKKKLITNYIFDKKHSFEAYNPLRAYISDKEFVKDYIASKIGNKYNVPTLAVFKNFNDFLNSKFPKNCCIKPTHLSGEVIFSKDNSKVNLKLIKQWMSKNYYKVGREKNYRYLAPKIIIEPIIFNTTNNNDYKFFCYKGVSKFVQVDIDRRKNHCRLYFDRNWKKLDFSINKDQSNKIIQKPNNFEIMLKIADNLSKDFEFIRIDLYTDENKIYVGELTNWPENGNLYFRPKKSEYLASKLLFDL